MTDPGGAASMYPSPDGTQFFCFHIHFHQKALMSEVEAPPPRKGVSAPQWEIVDPPLQLMNTYKLLQTNHHL